MRETQRSKDTEQRFKTKQKGGGTKKKEAREDIRGWKDGEIRSTGARENEDGERERCDKRTISRE